MIINVWSTPRTGSRWYSHYLMKTIPNSFLLSESFVKHVMTSYFYKDNNTVKFTNSYKPGCFYTDYKLVDGYITIEYKYQKRIRKLEEEESYLVDLLSKKSSKQNLIIHSHVYPINQDIRLMLSDMADKNIYVYRKNIREQFYSYIIASSTKEWANFNPPKENNIQVNDLSIESLYHLVEQINFFNSLEKKEILAYEDMPFILLDGLPYKQNVDHKNKLSENMIRLVEEVILNINSNQ